MTLALRRIVWPHGHSRPDDFNIIHEGKTIVGRIYRMNSSRELRRWTQIGLRAPSHGPNGGVADSLYEAKAAFLAARDAHG